jgi:hypothetical protein
MRLEAGEDQAAAWTADGALGLLRPRASGSRWGRNATRHDRRWSAATRRRTGIAPVATATLALTAPDPANSTASTATASTATVSMAARCGESAQARTARRWPATCHSQESALSTPPGRPVANPSPSIAAPESSYYVNGMPLRRPPPAPRRENPPVFAAPSPAVAAAVNPAGLRSAATCRRCPPCSSPSESRHSAGLAATRPSHAPSPPTAGPPLPRGWAPSARPSPAYHANPTASPN